MSLTPSVDNILSVYHRTPDPIRDEAIHWYDDAHFLACLLDKNTARSAGVIAVLSPMNQWPNNQRQAINAYCGRRHVGLGNNVLKATRILDGENPISVIGPKSRKVMAFFRSILDPNDETIEPVIDRHAFDLALGYRTDDKTRAVLSGKKVYQQFVDAYREAAITVNITPKQIQAITWVQWRNEK